MSKSPPKRKARGDKRETSVEKAPEEVITRPTVKLPDPTKMILGFPPDLYKDCGDYYELAFPQRSPQWLEGRKGRITASNFGKIAGLDKYVTRERYIAELAGRVKPEEFKYFQRRAMDQGTALEPYVRGWYEDEYKKKVIERGLIVPKWNMNIGVSVDGWIVNPDDGKKRPQGIVEIKCPQKMPPELTIHSERVANGEKFPDDYHRHIPDSHYSQMQGGIIITGASFCDYIVFSAAENQMYATRVMRNQKFWDEVLYPALLSGIAERDRMIAEDAAKAAQSA